MILSELYDSSILVLTALTIFSSAATFPLLGTLFGTFYTALAFSYLITPIIERKFHYGFARMVYWLSFFCVGHTILYAPLLAAAYAVAAVTAQYVPIMGTLQLTLFALGVSLGLAIYGVAQAHWIYTRKETIYLDVEEEFTAVHVSDLHLGAIWQKPRVEALVQKVNSLDPDYVFLTGDVFDATGDPRKDWLQPLEGLPPTFASLGNHDGYYGADRVEELLEEVGVVVLRNRRVDFEGVAIVGVDDEEIPGQNPGYHIEAIRSPEKPSFLLYHRPEGAEAFKDSTHDVMLAGHTHNGQLYPMSILLHFLQEHVYGFFNLGDKALNVSSGVSTSGPPQRLGTMSEIVHLTIKN